ncbi:hypothetical protein [Streptomyces tubercidicus]|uniref:hypothetical protein n=1 Tax=Streptomyces tubercidicus TaxID=47759 RepID=UPI0037ACEB0D
MTQFDIPDERKQELRRLVPDSVLARNDSCDAIMAQMSSFFGSSVSDVAAASGYMILFLQALANNCMSIWENPHFANPENGQPVQIVMKPYSWDRRGSKLYVGGEYLKSNNQNRQGDFEPQKDIADLFQFLPAGRKQYIDGQGNRQLYHIVVAGGSHAGKILVPESREIGTRIRAVEYSEDILWRWTLSIEQWGTVDRAIDSWYAPDGSSNSDYHHPGVLDVPGGKGDRNMQLYYWNETAAQLFSFLRPGIAE